MQDKGPRISLALGSGGARGLAHIGVIDWLLERGFRIESVAGSSIGALVGGMLACGRLEDYRRWALSIHRADIFALLDFAWTFSGLVRGDRIIDALRELTGQHQIEDLPLRYTAVASDLAREKEVWIQSGPLFDAIRASISMPLIFTPFEWRERHLVDGGVMNPVPIAPTFRDSTQLTIAVNLGGQPTAVMEAPEPRAEPHDPDEAGGGSLSDRVSAFIRRMLPHEPARERKDWSALEVANQCIDSMQGALARQQLAAYPPDHVVTVPRDACGMLDFHRAGEMIELGHRLAEEQLGQRFASLDRTGDAT